MTMSRSGSSGAMSLLSKHLLIYNLPDYSKARGWVAVFRVARDRRIEDGRSRLLPECPLSQCPPPFTGKGTENEKE